MPTFVPEFKVPTLLTLYLGAATLSEFFRRYLVSTVLTQALFPSFECELCLNQQRVSYLNEV